MKEILKKLVIATLTLFAALLLTSLVTKTNFFVQNTREIIIYYLAYIVIYFCVLLLSKKINKSPQSKDS